MQGGIAGQLLRAIDAACGETLKLHTHVLNRLVEKPLCSKLFSRKMFPFAVALSTSVY